MLSLGLTGGIGSGKTLVCKVLEHFGVPVYYADTEARKLMNSDPHLLAGIRALLGPSAYNEEGLDRKYVSSRVFGRQEVLDELNKLVHPVVREDFKSWSGKQDAAYVVEEAAVLFESGSHRTLDFTVMVYAPSEMRISRVMKRDGISEEEVRSRMQHQLSDEEKIKMADWVIYNDERKMLLPQIVELHEYLMNR